jgi:hypothetical protein
MDRDTFVDFRDHHFDLIKGISSTKGADYAGDVDALSNFKEAARELDVSPNTIWFVYFHKHWSAIRTFLQKGDVASEPIEGRIHDAILYLFLLLALIEDEKEGARVQRYEEGEGGPKYWTCTGLVTAGGYHPPVDNPVDTSCSTCGAGIFG